MNVVVDASALIEYLLRTDDASIVEEQIRRTGVDLHVPALCDIEITAGLRRALARELLTVERSALALESYLDLPLTKHAHQMLLERILELRANFSAYDATYVALAELLQADLLTADNALARAARTHTQVVVLPG